MFEDRESISIRQADIQQHGVEGHRLRMEQSLSAGGGICSCVAFRCEEVVQGGLNIRIIVYDQDFMMLEANQS